jgi:hypothetical protein
MCVSSISFFKIWRDVLFQLTGYESLELMFWSPFISIRDSVSGCVFSMFAGLESSRKEVEKAPPKQGSSAIVKSQDQTLAARPAYQVEDVDI